MVVSRLNLYEFRVENGEFIPSRLDHKLQNQGFPYPNLRLAPQLKCPSVEKPLFLVYGRDGGAFDYIREKEGGIVTLVQRICEQEGITITPVAQYPQSRRT